MSLVSWGKLRIFAKDLETPGASWFEIPTPVEDSTGMETTKGDKMEAKVEGGENEDTMYKRSAYALNFNVRLLKNRRNKPFPDTDGIVEHKYAVAVQPEDERCVGIMIDKATISANTTFSSADGIIVEYTADALKPDDGTRQVKYGTVTATGSGSTLDVTFVEDTDDSSEE